MSSIDTLAQLFMKFPGIGTRQAKRFVYFLLAQNPSFVEELTRELASLKKTISQCNECFRFFPNGGGVSVCGICANERDPGTLLVIEKDTDLENIERSGGYQGKYFVLGGLIPILATDPASKIRIRELLARLERGAKDGLKEIILALSVSPEGDFTHEYVLRTIEPVAKKLGIRITALGRGLSMGTELEYSDSDTLKHALKNRS